MRMRWRWPTPWRRGCCRRTWWPASRIISARRSALAGASARTASATASTRTPCTTRPPWTSWTSLSSLAADLQIVLLCRVFPRLGSFSAASTPMLQLKQRFQRFSFFKIYMISLKRRRQNTGIISVLWFQCFVFFFSELMLRDARKTKSNFAKYPFTNWRQDDHIISRNSAENWLTLRLS